MLRLRKILRDIAALVALLSLLRTREISESYSSRDLARDAYAMADDFMAARNANRS
ncbi:hypothetical protein GCM10023188_26130 [Pontibacter saemangeumensis]|uniref:Uncharacterized protein n=1 Tax=Pontibacter saemangeumensis TaxID=1084525 RepID=A0ABP8LRC6_9BACT